MRAARLAPMIAVLAAGACTSERLRLEARLPESLASRVVAGRLSVLEPPPLAPFSCDDLAFGRPAAAQARRSTVQQAVLGAGTTELAEVDRAVAKLFWLEALQADGRVVAQACAEASRLDGRAHVRLDAEPTAFVIAPFLPELYGGDSLGSLPAQAVFTLQDALARPLAGRQIEWQLVGPGYVTPVLQGLADAAGDASVWVPTPERPGPHLVEVRARWQSSAPEPLRGLVAPRLLTEASLPAWVVDYVVGRLGPGGEPGFAALLIAEGAATPQVTVFHFDGAGFVVSAPGVPVPGQDVALGVVTRPDGDHVVTIAPDPDCGSAPACWIEITAGRPTIKRVVDAPAKMTRMVHIGACGPGDADQVLVRLADGSARAYDSLGVTLTRPFATLAGGVAEVMAAGCVVDTAGVVRRAVVARTPEAGLAGVIEASDVSVGYKGGPLPVFPTAAGFMPALGGAPPLLVAAEVSLTGLALAHYRLRVRAADVQPVLQDSQPTLPSPVQLAGADLDGDAVGDVVGLTLQGLGGGAANFYRVTYWLGQEHRDEHLYAMSDEELWRQPRLLIADFDGDGCDDVLIGETGQDTGTARSTVRISSLCE